MIARPRPLGLGSLALVGCWNMNEYESRWARNIACHDRSVQEFVIKKRSKRNSRAMWAMTSLSSLYRNYLRQVRSLPHHYLRWAQFFRPLLLLTIISSQFFQIKASDDFRAIAATPLRKPHLRQQKIRRVSKVGYLIIIIATKITCLAGLAQNQTCPYWPSRCV